MFHFRVDHLGKIFKLRGLLKTVIKKLI